MGFFKWFDCRNFLDTYQEWHALVNGFCEVVCPWPTRYKPSEENEKDIADEFHYYQFGRVLGLFTWIGLIALIKNIVT